MEKYAYLCSKCLRECKQSIDTKIVTCLKFKEQLTFNFQPPKKHKKPKKSKQN